MDDVPKQYKEVFDKAVLDIVDAVNTVIPMIEELGNELTFDVEDFVVSIKRKELKDE